MALSSFLQYPRISAHVVKRALVFLSRYSTIIGVGLLVRLLIMPFTIQSDIIYHTWIAHFVVEGHVDVYRYYFQQFGTVMYPPVGQAAFPAAGFPPLFYIIDAGYLIVLKMLGVFNFLSKWSIDNILLFADQSRVFFFMKALYIPFDLLGLITFLLCLDAKHRRAGACSWMFNPAIIYVTYAWGQSDIIPVAFCMIALYFAKRGVGTGMLRHGVLSCLSLGLSASFKLFTMTLLPVFLFFLPARSPKFKLYYLVAWISPLVLVVPFVSKPFLDSMHSYPNYLLSRSSVLNYPQFTLYIVVGLYVAIIYCLYLLNVDWSFDRLLAFGLAVFSLLFGFSVWIPNWLLWVMPFLLLAVFRRPALYWVYVMINASYFVFSQAWGNAVWLGLFYPLSGLNRSFSSLGTFPNLWTLLGIDYWSPSFQLLVGSAYTTIGISMFFVTYLVWKPRRDGVSPSCLRWSALLAIPIALGALTLVLGDTYLREHGLPIIPTLAARLAEDPWFFVFYFIIVSAICVWLIIIQKAGVDRSEQKKLIDNISR
jgi:hypothetical protein